LKTEVGPIELFTAKKLVELIPGSTRKRWLTVWVPALVKRNVLVKSGQQWLGRRTQIETALAPMLVASAEVRGGGK